MAFRLSSTDLERAFKVFDKNQDGRISKEELEDVLKGAGIDTTEQQLDEFMQKIDLDSKYIVKPNRKISRSLEAARLGVQTIL